jgi:predicted lipoprotein with Yx(FWY)xxD motif
MSYRILVVALLLTFGAVLAACGDPAPGTQTGVVAVGTPVTQPQPGVVTPTETQPQTGVVTPTETQTETAELTVVDVITETEITTDTDVIVETQVVTLTEVITQAEVGFVITQTQVMVGSEMVTDSEMFTETEVITDVTQLTDTETITEGAIETTAQTQVQTQTIGIREQPGFGRYLADVEGRAYYTYRGEQAPADLQGFEPVPAGEADTVAEGLDAAQLGLVENHGIMQLTYQGLPLYRYTGDPPTGEITGHGQDQTWYIINVEVETANQ